jgi:hypothetical protein
VVHVVTANDRAEVFGDPEHFDHAGDILSRAGGTDGAGNGRGTQLFQQIMHAGECVDAVLFDVFAINRFFAPGDFAYFRGVRGLGEQFGNDFLVLHPETFFEEPLRQLVPKFFGDLLPTELVLTGGIDDDAVPIENRCKHHSDIVRDVLALP